MSKRIKRYSLILVPVMLLVILYFALPYYARRALIYQNVDISDYQIFDNNKVIHQDAFNWPYHSCYGQIKMAEADSVRIAEYHPVSFLLIHQDSIVFERYWEGYNDTMISNAFSVTKSLVSLLVGVALDEKLISDINDPVFKYLPEYPNLKSKDLTIKSLLTMSSGLSWDEAYSSLFSSTTKAYYGDDLKQMIRELYFVNQPNTVMYYSSMDTQILGLILQKVTGLSLSEYMQKKIWSRIGAEQDALWSKDHKNGIEKAYCCFITKAKDLAKIGKLILNNGLINQDTIVSSRYISAMITPKDYLHDEKGMINDYYGYQWWIVNYKGYYIPYARGVNGQYLFVIPQLDAILVRMGNDRSKEYEGSVTKDINLYLEVAVKMIKQLKNEKRESF